MERCFDEFFNSHAFGEIAVESTSRRSDDFTAPTLLKELMPPDFEERVRVAGDFTSFAKLRTWAHERWPTGQPSDPALALFWAAYLRWADAL